MLFYVHDTAGDGDDRQGNGARRGNPAGLLHRYIDERVLSNWRENVADSGWFFREIKRHPERFYIIHYSSRGLYDEGAVVYSPRITSIVIMHYATHQTISNCSPHPGHRLGG